LREKVQVQEVVIMAFCFCDVPSSYTLPLSASREIAFGERKTRSSQYSQNSPVETESWEASAIRLRQADSSVKYLNRFAILVHNRRHGVVAADSGVADGRNPESD
jgi:hypothetical protein